MLSLEAGNAPVKIDEPKLFLFCGKEQTGTVEIGPYYSSRSLFLEISQSISVSSC